MVAHDKARVQFLDGPRRREAAWLRQARSTTAFRRCYWLFNGGMAMLFRIKDGHLWTWISFLYFLGCLFGRFVRFKSGLKLSIDCHIKLLDERRPGAYWRRISVLVFRGGMGPFPLV
jgi:hypothetical protein